MTILADRHACVHSPKRMTAEVFPSDHSNPLARIEAVRKDSAVYVSLSRLQFSNSGEKIPVWLLNQ